MIIERQQMFQRVNFFTILFKLNIKIDTIKIYLLGLKDCNIINKMFNKLYEEGKLDWTSQSTLYNYSIFIL